MGASVCRLCWAVPPASVPSICTLCKQQIQYHAVHTDAVLALASHSVQKQVDLLPQTEILLKSKPPLSPDSCATRCC